jgi:hypothetical protein
MIELFSLVKSLNKDEAKSVISSFKRVSGADADVFLLEKLTSHILNDSSDIQNDKKLSQLIYKSDKPAAIAKLKSRLFYHVLEVLCSDQVCQRDGYLAPCDRQILRIRKKMLEFRVIYRKSNPAKMQVLFHLLNEICKEAKEYEQYDTLVEALTFKKYFLMLRRATSDSEKIEKEIEFYSDAHRYAVKSNAHYFNLITNQEVINKLRPNEKETMLQTAVQEVKTYVDITNSALITYLHMIFKLELLLVTRKYTKTVPLCNAIVKHLIRNKHLYRKEWLGHAYDNLSYCQVFLQDYKSAAKNCEKAQSNYDAQNNSLVSSKQQEFFVNFYAQNYRRALHIMNDLLNFPIASLGMFRYDKFLFLKACALFQMKEYKPALAICERKLELSKDKWRWGLATRYLRIMCWIELNDHDKAFTIITAYRKLVERNSKNITVRDQNIYKLLNGYGRARFRSSSSKIQNLIKKLSEENQEHSWEFYTHELIPIHSWVNSKLK